MSETSFGYTTITCDSVPNKTNSISITCFLYKHKTLHHSIQFPLFVNITFEMKKIIIIIWTFKNLERTFDMNCQNDVHFEKRKLSVSVFIHSHKQNKLSIFSFVSNDFSWKRSFLKHLIMFELSFLQEVKRFLKWLNAILLSTYKERERDISSRNKKEPLPEIVYKWNLSHWLMWMHFWKDNEQLGHWWVVDMFFQSVGVSDHHVLEIFLSKVQLQISSLLLLTIKLIKSDIIQLFIHNQKLGKKKKILNCR